MASALLHVTDALAAHCKLTPLPVLLPVTAAVTAWHTHVARTALHGVLMKYGVKEQPAVNKFIKTWNTISGQQLGATLKYLKPASEVNVFEVSVPVGEHMDTGAVQVAPEVVVPSAAVVTEAGH